MVAAVYTKSQTKLDGAVDNLFLEEFVSVVSLLAGIAWDVYAGLSQQQNYLCAFTVEDISVSVLPAADIFGS